MLVSIVNLHFLIDPSQAFIQLKKYQTPVLSCLTWVMYAWELLQNIQ